MTNTPEKENDIQLTYQQTYLKNKRLPRAGVEFEWTPERIKELKKAQEDILHFAENYFYIITTDEGKTKIQLYPAQKRVIKSLVDNRFVVVSASRQCGKCFCAGTKIKIRNKKTGKEEELTIEEFFDRIKGTNSCPNPPTYKFKETYDIGDYEIETDTGWESISHIHKTIPFDVWLVETETGKQLECADDHILIDDQNNEIFVKNCIPNKTYVKTINGIEKIVFVQKLDRNPEEMFDVTIESSNHTLFTNNILSHNTTMTTIYALWFSCFQNDKRTIIVANKEKTAIMILRRIKTAYEELPNWMKPGVEQWGNTEVMFENGSSIAISTTTGSAVRGETVNCVTGNEKVIVRNKRTGQIQTISVKDLTDQIKNKNHQLNVFLKNIDLKECVAFENDEYEILTEQGFKEFKGVLVGKNDQKIKITTNSRKSLTCTPKHKIMIDSKNYEYAENLNIGDQIFGGDTIKEKIEFEDDEPVYEILDVKDTHTYFVNDILSHQCLVIDEMGYIQDHLIEEFWASVIPAISSSKKRSTKIFAVSTPNGASGKFYEIFTKAKENENGEWKAEQIDWTEVPGRGKLWKRDMLEALGGDHELFSQEFSNNFISSGHAAIDKEMLEQYKNTVRDPIMTFEDGHYKLWKEPQEKHLYGIGVDVGEGIGKAASVVQVLDFSDLTKIEQVAVYSDNTIHPLQFAEVLYRMGNHWGRPPILIERNNIGAQVVDALVETHGYPNLVSYKQDGTEDREMRFGVFAHTNTKYSGVMNMRYWVNTLKTVQLYDIGTINELQTFVRYPNGTWKAKSGINIFDDRVMSLIWGLFLLEPEITERYYEILEKDEQGKPLRLQNYVIDTSALFRPDPMFQQDAGGPLPSYMGGDPTINVDTTMSELIMDGWRRLGQQPYARNQR